MDCLSWGVGIGHEISRSRDTLTSGPHPYPAPLRDPLRVGNQGDAPMNGGRRGRNLGAMPRSPLETRSARGGTLVLGGGFAGAYVARGLGRHGATIVNPSNFMLYTPLLPEAAAGSIEPRHVTVPLRTMCPHADLLLGSVTALDTEARVAHVSSEAGTFAVSYDRLVIALGAVTRTPEGALALKDIGDAIRLRNHVLRQI